MGYPKPPCKRLILGATVIITSLLSSIICNETPPRMTREEREDLKEEARDMFYHAYRAYMENAYPADELMPLSCAGRYRGLAPNRGDMDDILGNFSLTLIDTLDTLVILGDLEEFEHAVKLIVTDVSFDSNIVVSVFETNIRVLGGLLSGHVLAEYLQQRAGILQWYRGELLDMAKDLGFRLMPAFNTTTGIPHARINLKHGMKGERLEASRETCTACAGTMILEMAALSRLTGEPIFEEKAHRAMDELWKMRHRSSDLMGTILNVHSGDWVRRDSGVGAGIDSYYEYCLKAYILLGEERYLNRFNRHYSAVMKYVSQGPMLLDVHMHRPHTNSRNFMDALLAFWPGLQVLKGDIKPAVETHEMLYQVMQRHKFIPEAFTTDFQVHWGQHPLRPEFLESTYFLHRATNDPYYLEVGRNVLKSLQKYARVPCGYAAVNDVRTGKHEDRMDSFVLAETFKYLFLLFATEQELLLDLNEFIFTTEAHLLPLSLAAHSNRTIGAALDSAADGEVDDSEFARTCPNTFHLFPESVRRPLRNMVDGVCPRRLPKRRLTASEFQVSDPHHMNIIKDMGINILALSDGRIQLLHTFSSARSTADAEEGLLFMQEMVELSKAQAQQPDALPQGLVFPFRGSQVLVTAGPSHFSPELREDQRVTGRLAVANPFRACGDLQDTQSIKDRIVVIERGDCMFVDKARRLQRAGAIAGIVVDNTPGSSASTSPMFAMSGDGTDDVKIPVVFLFAEDASKLLLAATANPGIEVTIGELKSLKAEFALSSEETVLQKIKLAVDELNSRRTSKSTLETSLGDFHASLNHGTFKIMYKKSDSIVKVPEETKEINPKWAGLRKYIVLHLLGEDDRELSITPNILSLYYQSYSGASEIEIQKDDPKVQIEWLLTQLQMELNELNNGPLEKDKIEINAEGSFNAEGLKLISDEQLKWQLKQIGDNVHIKINSILETISKLQNNIGEIRKQFSDDLIIKDVKDNVDKVIESSSDETRTSSDSLENTDEIVTARPKINDEL